MVATITRSESSAVPRWIFPVPEEDTARRTFGQILEDERTARGWSQEYVGATIGVRQAKISEYENDKVKDPPLSKVLALENLYGLDEGTLAAVLWGDRVREQIRALLKPTNTFVILPDSPEALREVIELIGTLEEDEIEAERERMVAAREARRRGRESVPRKAEAG